MARTPSTFVQDALKRWHTANNAETTIRAEALTDKKFRNLEQWPEDIKQSRSESGRERPCLTIDQISEPIRQICNRQKEAKPSIQINPVSNGANEDGAEVRQGLIRRIEVDSHAPQPRGWAFEDAVTCGFGYYRITTDYEHKNASLEELQGLGPAAMDQVIRITEIENNFSVYCDPAAVAPDRRDARFYLICKDLPTDEYERLYPTSDAASLEETRGIGDDLDADWFPEGKVRVAEYWYKAIEHEKIALLSNGQIIRAKDADTFTSEILKQQPGTAITVVKERTVERTTVKWALINGVEVLDKGDWPGQYIPIIPVFGERLNVNGERTYRGIVRAARDPQRMYNYQNSALVEDLALAPKAKVIMAEGQDEGHEDEWEAAPTQNMPYLTYKPTTIAGEPAPPPMVAQFTDPAKIQSLVVAINQAKADLRSTTGFYDSTDPNRKNADQSGRAILARKESMAQGSVNYLDALHWAITFEAEIILDLLPKIYDRAGRVVEILTGESEARKTVMLNQSFVPDDQGQPQPAAQDAITKGAATLYDLTRGRYGVTVSIGASYTTRRQEAVEWQIRLIESNPQFFGPAMADIAVRNMDGPGHQEIADRLERAVPPQLKGEQNPQDPAALQQKLQMAMQQAEQMTKVIHELQDAIETKQAEQQGETQRQQIKLQSEQSMKQQELAAKLQIEQMEIEAEIQIAQMKIAAEKEIARLKADVARDTSELHAHVAHEAHERRAELRTT
jgi:hypothetical protein